MTPIEKSIGALVAKKLIEAEFDFAEISSIGLIENANGIWSIRFYRGKQVQKGEKRYVTVILGKEKETADLAYSAYKKLSDIALNESFKERLLREHDLLEINVGDEKREDWRKVGIPVDIYRILLNWNVALRKVETRKVGVCNGLAKSSGW